MYMAIAAGAGAVIGLVWWFAYGDWVGAVMAPFVTMLIVGIAHDALTASQREKENARRAKRKRMGGR